MSRSLDRSRLLSLTKPVHVTMVQELEQDPDHVETIRVPTTDLVPSSPGSLARRRSPNCSGGSMRGTDKEPRPNTTSQG